MNQHEPDTVNSLCYIGVADAIRNLSLKSNTPERIAFNYPC